MSDTEEKEVPERIVGGYQHGLGPAATPADCRGYRGPVPVRGRAQHPNGHLHRLPATRDTPGEASSPATMPMQWALLNRPPPLPLPQFGYRGNTRGYFFFFPREKWQGVGEVGTLSREPRYWSTL